MISIRFGSDDLARVRFATSPLFELWQSVRALQDPAARSLHSPWIAESHERLENLDLRLLYALQPPRGTNPNFIHPPPKGPAAELDDELDELLSTRPETIRREVAHAYRSGPLPAVLAELLANPSDGLARLADVLRVYWRCALAPHWGRIKAVLDNDVLYRARQSADGGAQALFAELHDWVCYTSAQIVIDWCFVESRVRLNGRGLLLIPSVFVPSLAVMYEPPWQPALIYPARGAATLWEPVAPARDALGALIGGRRAALLEALDVPRSTTDLARHLGISAGSVSQHLSVLRSNGLVIKHRVRKVVLYSRSAAGELLAGGRSDEGEPERSPALEPKPAQPLGMRDAAGRARAVSHLP